MDTLDRRIDAHKREIEKRRKELREYAASTLGGLWQPDDNMTVPLTTRLIEQDGQLREMTERLEVLEITLAAKDMRLAGYRADLDEVRAAIAKRTPQPIELLELLEGLISTGEGAAEIETELSMPGAHAGAESAVVAQCDHDADNERPF